ncbi:MAG: hypothetical protein ACRCWO_07865 [Bosea sp. (in: a-proteobacteria)]
MVRPRSVHPRPALRLIGMFLVMLLFSLPALLGPARASTYDSWPPLTAEFPSTGGGGVMILGYDPVVAAGRCTTDFQARLADGAVYRNEASFDAVPTAGGILCTNGKWRAKDGSAEGTTPFEVFIKDGVKRGKP